MDQIPIRVLNQDTAGVLGRVERGETLEITNRGRAIAHLVPVAADPPADLIASGAVIPPTLNSPFLIPTVTATGETEAGELLSTLREEERW